MHILKHPNAARLSASACAPRPALTKRSSKPSCERSTARQDPLLGPAFAGVADWEAHIARLTQFWSSVALMTGTYHGQPMQAHAHLGLGTTHFARWLALFEETAAAHLPPAGAAHLMERARRIGASLEMGLVPLALPHRSSQVAAA